jgi:hypothetical protein
MLELDKVFYLAGFNLAEGDMQAFCISLFFSFLMLIWFRIRHVCVS